MKLPGKEEDDEQLDHQLLAHWLDMARYMMRIPKPMISILKPSQAEKREYRSKFARRDFSLANQTIAPSAAHIVHPVIPGPVAKLYFRKPTTPLVRQPGCV